MAILPSTISIFSRYNGENQDTCSTEMQLGAEPEPAWVCHVVLLESATGVAAAVTAQCDAPVTPHGAGTIRGMWLWIVLGVICTFLIAAVSIGVVSGSLAARPRRSVYDLEEAVEFVADRLPDDLTARISFDDVRSVLLFH